MRTALYLRVSTSQQKPDLQRDDLRSYAGRMGLEIRMEYTDVAVSGRKEERPQLHALMRAARTREFECVLVWKFDRFARSVAHLLHALDEFNHLGIRFISLQVRIPRISATQSTGRLPCNPWEGCHPVQRISATQSTGILPPSERSDAGAYE
jgi:DNA invertase Pin-like site-specific DNA recombinase